MAAKAAIHASVKTSKKAPTTIPFSVMFRLKDVQLPEGQWITAFVGPNLIHAPPGKDKAAAWPDTSYQTGFPLMHYLLGNPFG